MIRGIYTGAASMAARTDQINVIANNLANINTTGFKSDLTSFKALPEMLIRRTNDDGVYHIPALGSIDVRPVVGRMGTGVEVNEVFTQHNQGSLRATENAFDFAIEGDGFFTILTPEGERYTRDGSFAINDLNQLTTKEGHLVMGKNGPITIKINNFHVDKRGQIYINPSLQNPLERPVQITEAGLEGEVVLDRFRITRFERDRYIKKEGNSFYSATEESGPPLSWRDLPERFGKPLTFSLIQGFLETSNVNPIQEMVKMIEVQRSYEASQKTITSSDQMLRKLLGIMVNA